MKMFRQNVVGISDVVEVVEVKIEVVEVKIETEIYPYLFIYAGS